MPMIDVVVSEGTIHAANEAALLDRVTACLLQFEKVSAIPYAVANTGAFLTVLPRGRITAGGKPDRVARIQVLTPHQALNQEQRAGITAGMTQIVGELAAEPGLAARTWVNFVEAAEGGWGIAGTAYTGAGLGDAIRASLKR